MKEFSSEIQFSKPWRTYQERVLNELDEHLEDNHLHVIAAPGSGKTILGLEVVRRLNKPAVIFAPTIAIRDQWIDRFVTMFSQGVDLQAWISKDIRHPGMLTVSTYQGLHSVFSGQDEDDESEEEGNDDEEKKSEYQSDRELVIKNLKEAEVSTIVVDEAHHLRNEWWKCLIDVKENLENPTVVALTATPPCDVLPQEWERYKELCGPVDAEIPVPELVKEYNLCPHQDYIYFSMPVQKENVEIKEFRNNVKSFKFEICSNEKFTELLEQPSIFQYPESHIEKILADAAFFSSILIYLNHVTGNPPRNLLRIIGISKNKLPKLDLDVLEVLLTGCLYSYRQFFEEYEDVLKEIARDLKRMGAIERRKVKLLHTDKIAKLLVSSVSKLNSIVRIVALENRALLNDLRLVVLTDFIRKDDFPRDENDIKEVKRIGVVPIFEKIRKANIAGIRLGILSGTLVVIPKSAEDLLNELAAELKIKSSHIKRSSLKYSCEYLNVEIRGENKQKTVSLITKVFNKGGITVLIGTKSLLGEGWDAPSINSLVLASFVGSYMLSNQMRGRAIRTQEGNPQKVSNIWHLVCVEEGKKELSDDFQMLTRRLKSFVGVSFKEQIIENGIERLDVGQPPFSGLKIKDLNTRMKQKALDRASLRDEWYDILHLGDDSVRMVEEVRCDLALLPRRFVFANTIFFLFIQGAFTGLYFFLKSLESVRMHSGDELIVVLLFCAGLGALISVPFFLKALYLFLKHGPVASSIKQIGIALLKTLIHIDLIRTPYNKLRVKADKDQYGLVSCTLEGGTTFEKSLFLDSLQEILGPIDNPRYLLIRKTPLGRFDRKDYHVVPFQIGKKKESAEFFAKMWEKYVGSTELIYARTMEGRKLLLNARAHSLSTSFQKQSKRVKSWK